MRTKATLSMGATQAISNLESLVQQTLSMPDKYVEEWLTRRGLSYSIRNKDLPKENTGDLFTVPTYLTKEWEVWTLPDLQAPHREDGYALIRKSDTETVQAHYRFGQLHHETEPAIVAKGTQKDEVLAYLHHNHFHRIDKPSLVGTVSRNTADYDLEGSIRMWHRYGMLTRSDRQVRANKGGLEIEIQVCHNRKSTHLKFKRNEESIQLDRHLTDDGEFVLEGFFTVSGDPTQHRFEGRGRLDPQRIYGYPFHTVACEDLVVRTSHPFPWSWEFSKDLFLKPAPDRLDVGWCADFEEMVHHTVGQYTLRQKEYRINDPEIVASGPDPKWVELRLHEGTLQMTLQDQEILEWPQYEGGFQTRIDQKNRIRTHKWVGEVESPIQTIRALRHPEQIPLLPNPTKDPMLRILTQWL